MAAYAARAPLPVADKQRVTRERVVGQRCDVTRAPGVTLLEAGAQLLDAEPDAALDGAQRRIGVGRRSPSASCRRSTRGTPPPSARRGGRRSARARARARAAAGSAPCAARAAAPGPSSNGLDLDRAHGGPAPRVDRAVAHHARQPGAHAAGAGPVRVRAAPERDEGLLRDLFGELPAGAELARQHEGPAGRDGGRARRTRRLSPPATRAMSTASGAVAVTP